MGVLGSNFEHDVEKVVVNRLEGTVTVTYIDGSQNVYREWFPKISDGTVSWDEMWGTRILVTKNVEIVGG